MELEDLLASADSADWERAYQGYVQSGKIAIDDWLLQWLWERVVWPSKDYSIFYPGNVLIKSSLLGVQIQVTLGDVNKRRYVQLKLFKSNPYHPDFLENAEVSEAEWRFPAIGNPFIDQPNYERWEKLLFCKLLNLVLTERKGLERLIEMMRRH